MPGQSIAADDEPLAYVLVADDIAAKIASGELAPGTRLRSERQLAEIYGRAYGTIRKAMNVLRERGLIETIHGRGTYVKLMNVASSVCGDPIPGCSSVLSHI